MGNTLSNNTKNVNDNETLINMVDKIATNYILQQNMIDIIRFTDKTYRQNLIILTSYILEQKLTNLDLSVLKKRISPKKNTNTKNNNNQEKNIVYLANKNSVEQNLFSSEEEKKKTILYISKFYIKIMVLFSSIVSVIDPQYIYVNNEGIEKLFYLKDFNDIKMIDAENKKLKLHKIDNPMNLVKKRLSILKNKMESSDLHENNSSYVINPGEKLCSLNAESSTLTSEVGIKELDTLYYDIFDEDTETWSKRSKEMEDQYKADVLLFYQIFTGQKDKPPHIKSFEDIELLDFHNLQRCKNKDFFEDLLVSKNDKLFKKYLLKIEEIQEMTKIQKKKLLFILKTIFLQTETDSFIINPELTIDDLIQKQKQIKESIMDIYINCEKKFIEALLLYEKMYDNQYGELVQAQINNINTIRTINNENIVQSNNLREIQQNNIVLNNEILNNVSENMSSLPIPNQPQMPISVNVTNQPQMPVSENAVPVPVTNQPQMPVSENAVPVPVPVPVTNQPQMPVSENAVPVPVPVTNQPQMPVSENAVPVPVPVTNQPQMPVSENAVPVPVTNQPQMPVSQNVSSLPQQYQLNNGVSNVTTNQKIPISEGLSPYMKNTSPIMPTKINNASYNMPAPLMKNSLSMPENPNLQSQNNLTELSILNKSAQSNVNKVNAVSPNENNMKNTVEENKDSLEENKDLDKDLDKDSLDGDTDSLDDDSLDEDSLDGDSLDEDKDTNKDKNGLDEEKKETDKNVTSQFKSIATYLGF
uniref:Uncharacterized protein n=1 Tax=Florenciella sp. virus SA2 TaxID=3240092 RepID=A0AB39JAS7_9VIRU